MNTIKRYTRGKFGRIEKCNDGELVYYIDINKLSKDNELLYQQISKDNELLYQQRESCKLQKQQYKDKTIELKILSKKYSIVLLLSLIVNVIFIDYILIYMVK